MSVVDIATLTLDLQDAILAGDNLAEIKAHLCYSLDAEVGPCSEEHIASLAQQLVNLVSSRQEVRMSIQQLTSDTNPEQKSSPS